MIIKIIKGNGFGGLSRYLTRDDANARIIGSDNLPTEDPAKVARIMRQTANLSTRCKKPVWHFSARPAPSDRLLTDEEFLHLMRKHLKAQGMDDRQALFVMHDGDTPGKQHVHGMVCRVGNDGKAATLNNEKRIASRINREIEKDLGLRKLEAKKPKERAGQDTDKERRERAKKGRTSTDRHKEAAKAALARSAASGGDFRAILADQGFALARGDRRGVVIVDRSGKACSFSRALTKTQRDQLGIEQGRLPAVPAARLQLAQAAQNRRKTADKSLPQPALAHRLQKENAKRLRLQKENNKRKQQRAMRRGRVKARGIIRTAQTLTRALEIEID